MDERRIHAAGTGTELDFVQDSVVVLDGRGVIVVWNAASESLYGWSREQATGREARVLLGGDPVAPGHAVVVRDTAAGTQVLVEVRRTATRGDDGTLLRVYESGRDPTATRVGRGTTMMSVSDLTAQKQADDAVRQSEYRYRNLFDALGVAYLEIDSDRTDALLAELRGSGVKEIAAHLEANKPLGDRATDGARIVDVNERAAELFAAPGATELTGPTTSIWTPDSRRRFFEYLESRARSLVSSSVRMQLRTRDGGLVDVEMTAWAPPRRSLGARSLLALVDITKRVRTPAAVSTREALYDAMFRCFPIALVQLNGAHSLDGEETGAGSRRAADQCRGQDALQFLRHESTTRGVTIELELSSSEPRAKIDRVQMQQVLVNLAVNAMQAMSNEWPREKIVTIRTEVSEAVVRVAVEDRGLASPRGISSASSRDSSRPRRQAWGWDYVFAIRSSRGTKARFTRRTRSTAERSSFSRCRLPRVGSARLRRRAHRGWIVLRPA